MERKTKKVLGFDVDIITYNNALNLVSENIKNKSRNNRTGTKRH